MNRFPNWLFQCAFAGCLLASVSSGMAAESSQVERFFRLRSKLATRLNGLQLKLQATDGVAKEGLVQLSWILDYEGPRMPCTIIGPSLSTATFGQTVLKVYAESKSHVIHEIEFTSPFAAGRYVSQQEWFITLPDKGGAKGSLQLNLAAVKASLLKNWPADFDKEQAPPLKVQLIHQPTDRGDSFNLDAWTGTVYSQVVTLRAQDW